jgi:hypothetical protein
VWIESFATESIPAATQAERATAPPISEVLRNSRRWRASQQPAAPAGTVRCNGTAQASAWAVPKLRVEPA